MSYQFIFERTVWEEEGRELAGDGEANGRDETNVCAESQGEGGRVERSWERGKLIRILHLSSHY